MGLQKHIATYNFHIKKPTASWRLVISVKKNKEINTNDEQKLCFNLICYIFTALALTIAPSDIHFAALSRQW